MWLVLLAQCWMLKAIDSKRTHHDHLHWFVSFSLQQLLQLQWLILVGGHLVSSSLSLLNSSQDLKWTAMLLELHPSHVIQCYQSTWEMGSMTALFPICVQLLQLSELTLSITCLSTTAVRTTQVRCCVWLHILYNCLCLSLLIWHILQRDCCKEYICHNLCNCYCHVLSTFSHWQSFL